jgi:dolichol-phosphate mannosyltransferase
MQMDADLQHNPEDIPRFLSKAGRGYQFIIGSRYISGGDYPEWSFKRKLYSWGANLIARYIAGIYDIDDCTSGFRCISAKFLRSFDLKDLKSNGYAFQMSLLHAAHRKHIPITQIPILFPNRKKGESKLGHRDIREFFVNAVKLRFKRYHWLDKKTDKK